MTKRKPILAFKKCLCTPVHVECIVQYHVCTQLPRLFSDKASENVVSYLML